MRPDLSYLSVSLSTWLFAVSGPTDLTRIIFLFIEFCLSFSLYAWIFLLTRSLSLSPVRLEYVKLDRLDTEFSTLLLSFSFPFWLFRGSERKNNQKT